MFLKNRDNQASFLFFLFVLSVKRKIVFLLASKIALQCNCARTVVQPEPYLGKGQVGFEPQAINILGMIHFEEHFNFNRKSVLFL